jgi:preprotein translocase YajC subunit
MHMPNPILSKPSARRLPGPVRFPDSDVRGDVLPDDPSSAEARQGTKAMMEALAKGDEVVTAGGVLGKITKISDLYVTLEISSGAELVVQKNSITMVLPNGTLKSL